MTFTGGRDRVANVTLGKVNTRIFRQNMGADYSLSPLFCLVINLNSV